jgi:hypothetical protein
LRAAPCARIIAQRSIELDAIAVGREVGAAARLAEYPYGSAIPGNVGNRGLEAGRLDCLGYGGCGGQFDPP